jgi:hypothetical protein
MCIQYLMQIRESGQYRYDLQLINWNCIVIFLQCSLRCLVKGPLRNRIKYRRTI